MREVVLDTETTGLDPADGHRIVEIGAVELVNHVPSGASVHLYINPERDVPQDAFDIHGLSTEFLDDKPTFAAVVDEFLAFLGDAKLVIHNARFDIRFLDHELMRCGRKPLGMERALDTLELCKRRFPGAASTLDALCRRFGIDNSGRVKHGALLDSELLAEVYLELVGGRQPDLVLEVAARGMTACIESDCIAPPRPRPLPARLTRAEAEAHARFVAELGDEALWTRGALQPAVAAS